MIFRASLLTIAMALSAVVATTTPSFAAPKCELVSQNTPVTASTSESTAGRIPGNAVDGNTGTRWASSARGTQWLQVDLGVNLPLCRVVLNWEASYAAAYQVQTSPDGQTWTDAYATTGGSVGVRDVQIDAGGRYVRMMATNPGSPWNYSLWEFQVYASDSAPPPPLPSLKTAGKFLTAGGNPFYWQADTAWTLFTRLNRQEIKSYLDKRGEQRFNVIQVAAVAPFDGPDTSNAQGDIPFVNNNPGTQATTPGTNPVSPAEYDYWDHVDFAVNEATRRGIYVAMAPVWADYVVNGLVNIDNAQPYGEFLGRRYPHVAWVLGGGQPGYEQVWRNLASGIRKHSQGLVTYHPAPGQRAPMDDLDFVMQNNGHCPETDVAERIRNEPKPVVDGEPLYDNHPLCFAAAPDGHSDDTAVRKVAWREVFAGAFGHTYGHNSVWQFFGPTRNPLNEPRSYWVDAVDEAAAWQMRHLRGLIESRPMGTRIPDRDMATQPAMRAGDGAYAFVYTEGQVTVDLDKLSGTTANTYWFNPRTGAHTANGTVPSTGSQQFTPPSTGDWVLVLDDVDRGFAAPPTPGSTPTPSAPAGCQLASQGKKASASSSEHEKGRLPEKGVDGDPASRWSTAGRGTEWFMVDLGASKPVCRVVVNWEDAYASHYKAEISHDNQNWTDLFSTTTGSVGVKDTRVDKSGRYVRILATTPGTPQLGYSLWELQAFVKGSDASTVVPTCQSKLRVMALGDSITDGYELPGGYRTALWNRFTASGREVEFVGSRQNGPAELPDTDHEGHNGWQVSQLDAGLPAWLRNGRPDAVLLHIGTTDVEQSVDIANAAIRLGALIDRVTAVAPHATVYVSNLIPANHIDGFEALAAEYNVAVPRLVDTKRALGKRVVFVDQHSALTFDDLSDGQHPTAGGYAKMADKWFAALFAGCPPPLPRSAAVRHNWGSPHVGAEFTTAVDGGWKATGPWPGQGGQGKRKPEQVTVANGVATITGLPNGDTGHMERLPGSYRGRWEARVRMPPGCACYRPALTLWPDANDHPAGGEIVFLEVLDGARQEANFFLYSANSGRLAETRQVDLTSWNNVAVEWTHDRVTGYLNGETWFHTTRPEMLPPRAMHPTIKLDWYPSGTTTTSTLEVDWIREYRV